jgi:pSer/pThr/pTyr-binding forkhead associated (FHA) protein
VGELKPMDIEGFTRLANAGLDVFLTKVREPALWVADVNWTVTDVNVPTVRTTESSGQRADTGRQLVVPLIKRTSNTFKDMIWVGRALSCDVLLPFESVSKIHAFIGRDAEGQFVLSDAGSRNGTWINGVKLDHAARLPIKDHDRLRFGGIEAVYLSPKALFEHLSQGQVA